MAAQTIKKREAKLQAKEADRLSSLHEIRCVAEKEDRVLFDSSKALRGL
jgi:hypothetical protein